MDTYSFRLLVGGCEFLSLVLKAAQLDLELVKTAGQLRDVRAALVQLICKGISIIYRSLAQSTLLLSTPTVVTIGLSLYYSKI